MTQEEEQNTKRRINEKFNFPGVTGFVDGTHIRIKCPDKTSEQGKNLEHAGRINQVAYYNRKGYYSIKAMIVCDDKLLIRFVDARHAGSNHDSFVWKSSQVDLYLNQQLANGRTNFWILVGYNFSDRATTRGTYIKARNCVERCIGVIKNRFRCILVERGLHYEPEKVTKIINVCCALHNVTCIESNDTFIVDFDEPRLFENFDNAVEEASSAGN